MSTNSVSYTNPGRTGNLRAADSLVEDDLQPVRRLWETVVPETAVLQHTVVVHETGDPALHLGRLITLAVRDVTAVNAADTPCTSQQCANRTRRLTANAYGDCKHHWIAIEMYREWRKGEMNLVTYSRKRGRLQHSYVHHIHIESTTFVQSIIRTLLRK